MGAVDVERQALNVFRMRLLGSEVESVGAQQSRTLKDAVNEAMRDWVATVGDTHYCLGSVMGPHPYPWMVREFHRVIGDEAREQCRALTGADPDVVVACVGGGSNAIGIFSGFVDQSTRLVGVEPAGGAAVGRGVPGVVHGMRSLPDAGRVRAGRGGEVDLGRARLSRASGRSTRTWRRSGAPSTRTSPTPRWSRRSNCSPAPRASSRPSRAAHAIAWLVREAAVAARRRPCS